MMFIKMQVEPVVTPLPIGLHFFLNTSDKLLELDVHRRLIGRFL